MCSGENKPFRQVAVVLFIHPPKKNPSCPSIFYFFYMHCLGVCGPVRLRFIISGGGTGPLCEFCICMSQWTTGMFRKFG